MPSLASHSSLITPGDLSIAIILRIVLTKTYYNDLNFNTIQVLSHVAIKTESIAIESILISYRNVIQIYL